MQVCSIDHCLSEYQEADNIITFNHFMDFSMGPKEVRARSSFATVYESSILEWWVWWGAVAKSASCRDLHIHRQFIGRTLNNRTSDWTISLHGSGSREVYPPVSRLHFTLKAFDLHGNCLKTLRYFIDGLAFIAQQRNQLQPRRRAVQDQKSYATDLDSEFGLQLTALMGEVRRKDKTLQLETRMEFQKTSFVDASWLVEQGAMSVGEQKDFFFDALTNKFDSNKGLL